jgi:hypothetical protein
MNGVTKQILLLPLIYTSYFKIRLALPFEFLYNVLLLLKYSIFYFYGLPFTASSSSEAS